MARLSRRHLCHRLTESPSIRQYRRIDFLVPKVFHPNEPLKLVGSAQIPKRRW